MNRTTIALAVSLLAGLPGAALAQAGHDAHHLATPPAQVEQTPAPTPPAGRMSAMQGMMPEQCRAMMQAMTPECVGAMQQMMQGGMMQGMTSAPNAGASTTSTTTTASGAGQPHPTRSCQYVNAASMPMAPWAKLKMPDVV